MDKEEATIWCETKPELGSLEGTVQPIGGIYAGLEFTTGGAVSAFWAAEIVRVVWKQRDKICYAKVDGISWGKTRGTVLKLWD